MLFAIVVAFAMGFPASLNQQLQWRIEDQATERRVRAELASVFAVDPAFADLSMSAVHQKTVCITVHGSVSTRADFERLRSNVTSACPTLDKCALHWDVSLRDTSERVNGID